MLEIRKEYIMEEINRKYWAFIPETLIGKDSIDDLGVLIDERGYKKALIVTDNTVAKTKMFGRTVESLKRSRIDYAVFSGCKQNAPVKVIEKCAHNAKSENCDFIVGLGGGSAMDTAKVASVLMTNQQDIHDFIGEEKVRKPGLFKVLIPTTAGTGSEWSHPAIITDDRDGLKKPIFSKFTAADLAIIDPTFSLELPPKVTADTGIDTLTHLIEAYVSWKSNIISEMYAEKGIELVARSLRIAYAKGRKHIEARYDMCIAAAFGMAAHTSSSAGIAHSMNYPITAKTHVSHGSALALILPHVMEFNIIACPDKYVKIAQIMGEDIAGCSKIEAARKSVQAVKKLCQDLCMPQHLSEVGFLEDDIPNALDFLFENQLYGMENNPRDPKKEDFIKIYRAAL